MALEAVEATSTTTIEPTSSRPRISFSADFLDENNIISISPHSQNYNKEKEAETEKARFAEFEFLSSKVSSHAMLTADELFFEGKLLPFWQMQHSEKLENISLKTKKAEQEEEVNKDECRGNWFVDDDPSPRPPKCTVLWKELLKLKKQRAASFSSSSSSASSSSISSSGSGWLADIAATAYDQEGKEGAGNRDKHVKRTKKRLERTRSASIRIRPLINVPICTQVKSTALPMPPLFPLKKGRFERRRTQSHG